MGLSYFTVKYDMFKYNMFYCHTFILLRENKKKILTVMGIELYQKYFWHSLTLYFPLAY